MKRKGLAVIATLLPAVGLLFSSISNKYSFLPLKSQIYEYVLTLNSSNNDFLPSVVNSGTSTQNNSPKTNNGNPIIFSYIQAEKDVNRFAKLYSTG